MKRSLAWLKYMILIVVFALGSTKLSAHAVEADALSSSVLLDAKGDLIYKSDNVDIMDSFQGVENVLKMQGEDCVIEWNLNISEEGYYHILFDYCALESKYTNIDYSIYIDGKIPFKGADKLRLTRAWKNKEEIQSDSRGNHISPVQIPATIFTQSYAFDPEGIYNDNLRFYLSKGNHTLRLVSERGDYILASLELIPSEEIPSYSQVVKESDFVSDGPGCNLIVQGEAAEIKSDSTIIPTYDRGDMDTSPSDPIALLLNTIGGSKWQEIGQWITWSVNIPEDGYYKLSMRVKQNTVSGRNSYRRIYIDGEVPFAELGSVVFDYDNDWYIKTLGEEEPYLFYLEKGVHEIKMEVVPGELSEIRNELQNYVYELNDLYRQIIMITGTTVDIYRDYRIYEDIPDLLDHFSQLRDKIYEQQLKMEEISGKNGGSLGLLETLINQLDGFLDKPDSIPLRLDSYKANISSLSAWLLSLTQQPLEIDYFIVTSAGSEVCIQESSWLQKLVFSAKAILGSFGADYSLVGDFEESNEAITVWVGMGRDQVQILKDLIDSDFVPKTGIKVNVSLVQQGLVEATLTNEGPDVALFVEYTQPVNLAARGALVDLSQFVDYEEVIGRFSSEALIPFSYEGGVYALPCTQSFPMLFYRKDIFEELGLEPPQTWEDVYRIAAVLQRNNLTIGIGSDIGTFATLLYQKGGSFYNDELSATELNSESAMGAFAQWTDFFRKYSLPLSFDFQNRFRTGEMPVGIMSYATYNVLQVSAPEIKGLWEMDTIPGTVRDDGTIDYSVCGSSVDGAIIFEKTDQKEAAWEFLKWFTSTDVQGMLGIGLEAQMGASARYTTANMEALEKLPWNEDELSLLYKQWENVKEIPQIPASYYITRNINNAFRRVVNENENPRNTLNQYNYEMNKEVQRKREEFHLD